MHNKMVQTDDLAWMPSSMNYLPDDISLFAKRSDLNLQRSSIDAITRCIIKTQQGRHEKSPSPVIFNGLKNTNDVNYRLPI